MVCHLQPLLLQQLTAKAARCLRKQGPRKNETTAAFMQVLASVSFLYRQKVKPSSGHQIC
jgi:hypothetical protein